jgi:hypothetical protein
MGTIFGRTKDHPMKIKKKLLAKLDKVYAVSPTIVGDETRLIFATEGQGACLQFAAPELKQSTVWEQPGGTMTVVPIPGKNGDFLAVQNFFPTFQGARATVVWATPKPDGQWEVRTILCLPYVHRIDVLRVDGINYFLAATICTSKASRDDWSDPGKLWVGILPDRPDKELLIRPLREGLTRNHGYNRLTWKARERALVTCDEGVFILTPPASSGAEWMIEKLLDRPVSDIAVCDIDEDGETELLTIEPFHGQTIAISKRIGDSYEIVWKYEDKPVEFGHVAWGGQLQNIPTFICGYRRLAADLFYVQCESKNPLKFKVTMIEEGVGAANISVLHKDDEDIIMSSNRAHGEAVLYIGTAE